MAFAPVGEYTVTYLDGTTTVARSNFLGLAEVERRWPEGTEVPVMEGLAYAMWWYLDCPGEFDAFLRSVHMIEEHRAEREDAADPTVPAVGAA